MKTTSIFLSMAMATILSCGTLSAQEVKSTDKRQDMNPEELMDRRVQRMEKQLVMDDATAAKFSPLYKEYLKEMRSCFAGRKGIKKGETLTDAERTAYIESQLKCRSRMAETQEKYYRKFKGFLNARQLEAIFCKPHTAYRGVQCTQGHRHNGQKCRMNRTAYGIR